MLCVTDSVFSPLLPVSSFVAFCVSGRAALLHLAEIHCQHTNRPKHPKNYFSVHGQSLSAFCLQICVCVCSHWKVSITYPAPRKIKIVYSYILHYLALFFLSLSLLELTLSARPLALHTRKHTHLHCNSMACSVFPSSCVRKQTQTMTK